jgi:16S rRNA processing protein RimM
MSARPAGRDGAADSTTAVDADAGRWVVMGRVGAPFGVQGWVRIQTYSSDPDTLLDYERWWIRSAPAVSTTRVSTTSGANAGAVAATMQRPGARRAGAARATSAAGSARAALAGSEWREVEVIEAQGPGSGLIAHLDGIDDRDQAAQANGIEIGLLRDDLPPPEEDEFYWEDLIGLDAVDPQGQKFGVVSGLLEAGAHDVLVIDTPGRTAAGKPLQVLVPFVERHVGEVDLAKKQVVVDWEEPV